jgi:hypothetical protein
MYLLLSWRALKNEVSTGSGSDRVAFLFTRSLPLPVLTSFPGKARA